MPRLVLIAFACLVSALAPGRASAEQLGEIKSEFAIMLEAETGNVIYQKNADKPFPPASLAKLMTMALIFDRLKSGELKPETEFPVSVYAWRTGGAPSGTSTMFAPVNQPVKVSDIVQGIAVQSANDGSIAAAEGIAGNESAFASLMNRKAVELGMKNSNFRNPTGLPDPAQRSTARDLSIVARYLVLEHADRFPVYGQREFTYNNIRQQNRNPLLRESIGADGMKTGFIRESGYNIVGTAVRDGTRLIVVLGGARTEKDRADDARKLLLWGFDNFETISLFADAEKVVDVPVYGGLAPSVPAVAKGPIRVFSEKGQRERLSARVVYTGPLAAPVTAGQPIGVVRVRNGDRVVADYPVVAGAATDKGPIPRRALHAVGELLLGWF